LLWFFISVVAEHAVLFGAYSFGEQVSHLCRFSDLCILFDLFLSADLKNVLYLGCSMIISATNLGKPFRELNRGYNFIFFFLQSTPVHF
jgi:hypothetical protein